eukprot:TRINITY_DN366_c0_g2_i3.p1 TRINITY_DN366_c0_g2~~TRINITY_DN366_c0_g2_i3.p1  ORF type:complete len:275 (-),score=-1.76 TRINITY_DN366_c0_g2_i3:946-1770(-)
MSDGSTDGSSLLCNFDTNSDSDTNSTDSESQQGDWTAKPERLEGIRFREDRNPCGPCFDIRGSTPFHIFSQMLVPNVIRVITSNNVANAAKKGVSLDLDAASLRTFLGVLLSMDLDIKPDYSDYWHTGSTSLNYTPGYATVMSRDRFLTILGNLCFHSETNKRADFYLSQRPPGDHGCPKEARPQAQGRASRGDTQFHQHASILCTTTWLDIKPVCFLSTLDVPVKSNLTVRQKRMKAGKDILFPTKCIFTTPQWAEPTLGDAVTKRHKRTLMT